MNGFVYDDEVLIQNEEVYVFMNSYLVTEPTFDENTIEESIKALERNNSIHRRILYPEN